MQELAKNQYMLHNSGHWSMVIERISKRYTPTQPYA
jgi:hypothetical protein